MWIRRNVTIAIYRRICGGTPTDPKLIDGWLKRNMPKLSDEERAKMVDQTLAELGTDALEKAKIDGMWTCFKKNDSGIYIEGRQVKSMLKEAANVLRDLLMQDEAAARKAKKAAAPAPTPAEKEAKEAKSRFVNLRSRVAERLHVEEHALYFWRDGKRLLQPDGFEERAIHVIGPQGPRNALKREDYVEAPAEVRFTLRWLNDGVVDDELIRDFFQYAEWNGLGASRSQDNGKFALMSIEEIAPAEKTIKAA
jgi:hypothetical protein